MPYPVLPDTAPMLYAMDRAVHAAVAGDMSVGQALRQLARDINASLAKRGATT